MKKTERENAMSTEVASERFRNVDAWSTENAVRAMIEGQMSAVASVMPLSGIIAEAANAAAERLVERGRLVYVGAGTSGRLAAQDGIELHPTYGWPDERLVYMVAGGTKALLQSAEGAEDDEELGKSQIANLNVTYNDVVIGVAASGKTPFTISALACARKNGALVIGIANNPETPLLDVSDFGIAAGTGSEIIAGSTRMKAGTAQKAILNILSTAIMVRLGRVHKGLMVNMVISNNKLRHRGAEIIHLISGISMNHAEAALSAADDHLPTAILMGLGVEKSRAKDLLESYHGQLGASIAALGK